MGAQTPRPGHRDASSPDTGSGWALMADDPSKPGGRAAPLSVLSVGGWGDRRCGIRSAAGRLILAAEFREESLHSSRATAWGRGGCREANTAALQAPATRSTRAATPTPATARVQLLVRGFCGGPCARASMPFQTAAVSFVCFIYRRRSARVATPSGLAAK